jgi:hypothetical protein
MRSSLDPRVVPAEVLAVLDACQQRVRCRLGGGAALSGGHLVHRVSRDVDLVFRDADDVRALVRALPEVARSSGSAIALVRDAGTFVRATVRTASHALELDAVYDSTPAIEEGPVLGGIALESLVDLRAAKLTCILSRSEPRDLVDLLFLDRAGFPPEEDLPFALLKDGGIDPGILSWLLAQFPLAPRPMMLLPLTQDELEAFRTNLVERFRRVAVGE